MPESLSNAVVRAYQAETLECLDGERAVIARVNTAEVDRYRTVIEPAGIKLEAYRKNPVVLWEHGRDPNRGSVPVARCQWIKYDRSNNCLIAKAVFGTDPFADQIFRMYQDRTLNAFSVNILPEVASPPTKEERVTQPDLDRCEMVYRSSELAEFSSVGVPGNANALALAVSRGFWVTDEVRSSLPKVDPKEADDDDDDDDDGDDDKDDKPKRDMDADGGEGDTEECFDKSKLRCTMRHADGHCPRCGEPMTRMDEDRCRCMRGHECPTERALDCQFKEKDEERSAALPPLTGKPFSDIYAELVMQVRSHKTAALKRLREEIDLMKGRV